MLRNFRSHLAHNVVGYVAVFIALGGTGYAAATVGSGNIKNNAVLSRHIKNGEVKKSDLAANAVGTGKVIDGSLLGRDFKAGQLPAGPRGPSNAYYVHGNVLNGLPAGDYAVTGQFVAANTSPTSAGTVTGLKAVGFGPGNTLAPSSSPSSQATLPPGTTATIPFQAIVHLSHGGTIDASYTSSIGAGVDMTAVRVSTASP